ETEARINELLKKGENELRAGQAKSTYEGTFLVWDSMCGEIDTIGSIASWDFNTSTDAALRDKSEKTEELVGKVTARLFTLPLPYGVLKSAFEKVEGSLSWDRKSFARDTLRSFEHNGVHLTGPAKERVKAIDQEMIELGTRFSK